MGGGHTPGKNPSAPLATPGVVCIVPLTSTYRASAASSFPMATSVPEVTCRPSHLQDRVPHRLSSSDPRRGGGPRDLRSRREDRRDSAVRGRASPGSLTCIASGTTVTAYRASAERIVSHENRLTASDRFRSWSPFWLREAARLPTRFRASTRGPCLWTHFAPER